jgi:phage/plasmid-like protein (TIGR03299 family)
MMTSSNAIKTFDVSASSVEESFDQSGLNWIAEQSEIINPANGKVIDGHKVIYRSDNGNQLGVVGSKYGVVQNSDCFAFFNEVCKKNNTVITKVNEYHGGSVIHLEAEVKDKTLAIKKGDECGFRFNLFNSFNGLSKARVTFSVLRMVCSNGLISVVQTDSIEIKHTMHAMNRLDQAVRVWSGGEQWYNSFSENAKILNQKMVDTKMVESFLTSVFGNSESGVNTRKKEAVTELFEHGKGNNGETAWDLVNGLTEYVDHYSKETSEDRLEYSTIGNGYDLKANAFAAAMAL